MLLFDSEKLRCVYVFAIKITATSLYVTSSRNGGAYLSGKYPAQKHGDFLVTKIPIHNRVSSEYIKHYKIREYSEPKLMSLNYYGDEILSIEAQVTNPYLKKDQKSDNWKSYFSKSISEIHKQCKNYDAYINGSEIMWLPKNKGQGQGQDHDYQRDERSGRIRVIGDGEMSISSDDSLTVKSVLYTKIGSIGTKTVRSLRAFRMNRKASDLNISLEDYWDDEFIITNFKRDIFSVFVENDDVSDNGGFDISAGSVLTYYYGEGEFTYSPILRVVYSENGEGTNDLDTILSISNPNNRIQANIEFVLKASKVIGETYGYEKVDFFGIPRIIEQTKELSLEDIAQSSRQIIPTHVNALDAIVYLIGFTSFEKKLNKMRDLCSVFRYVLSNGIIDLEDIDSIYVNPSSVNDLPHLNLGYFDSKKEIKIA